MIPHKEEAEARRINSIKRDFDVIQGRLAASAFENIYRRAVDTIWAPSLWWHWALINTELLLSPLYSVSLRPGHSKLMYQGSSSKYFSGQILSSSISHQQRRTKKLTHINVSHAMQRTHFLAECYISTSWICQTSRCLFLSFAHCESLLCVSGVVNAEHVSVRHPPALPRESHVTALSPLPLAAGQSRLARAWPGPRLAINWLSKLLPLLFTPIISQKPCN